jgi:DNA-binding CsgD family transcriptional regulator
MSPVPALSPLIGRSREAAELDATLTATRAGRGELLLLAGEAGVGKTRLATEVLYRSGLFILHSSLHESTLPHASIAAVLRAYLRIVPGGLSNCGSLTAYLSLLLPELGSPPAGGDRATLFEAVRGALEAIARRQPTVLYWDDLQWADNATLELLPTLVDILSQCPLLILGVYRNDEIPRGHPLRRLRADLRRKGQLHEITVEPLKADETAALAAHILGGAPSPALAATLYDRTQGLPFFVEELAAALVVNGRIQMTKGGAELIGHAELPIPDTIRDTVLLRVERLSQEARHSLEIAATIGMQFDLDLVAELMGSEAGLGAALESGLVIESDAGQATFRHALMREAVYSELPWPRRRALHREIAARLERQNAPLSVVAEHWQVGRDVTRARNALVQLADKSCAVHAYRDAANAARRALELWPEGEEEEQRLDLLDRLGSCAQLNGDVAEAVRAWREVAEYRRQAQDWPRFADSQRRLASIYELQSNWEQALAVRRAAADAFTQSHLPAEAAAERLAIAAHLSGACYYSAAIEVATLAAADADRAGRLDLQISALAAKGECLAKSGQYTAGREMVNTALSLALEHNLIGPASDAYSCLAAVLQQSGDYAGACDAYEAGIELCQTEDLLPVAQFCLACLAVVLRDMGAWDQALDVCQAVLAAPEAEKMTRLIARGMLGAILGWRGQARQAHSLLVRVLPEAQRVEKASLEMNCLWSLANVEELLGQQDAAATRYRDLLQRWERTEERLYIVPALRWAVTFFADLGAPEDTRACARALATIVSATGKPDAVAALAHALGEAALLDGDAQLAARQFEHALDALAGLELPFDRAHIQLRAGVALVAAGQRALGVERLVSAYRIAVKLKAKPLAERAARELAALGEKVEKRLGRKAARGVENGGLTPREREVLRHLALGRTNREIAKELFLSPRTVDMFVRNILGKLNCSSRFEASRKAEQLGLLG